MSEVSPGEAGGIFAGIIAVLGVIGAGIKWLADYALRRASSRESKLEKWHNELDEREKRLDEGNTAYVGKLEQRLSEIESGIAKRDEQLTALRLAFQLVADELRARDPGNKALTLAEQLLTAAFPPVLTADTKMQAALGALAGHPSVGLALGEKRTKA